MSGQHPHRTALPPGPRTPSLIGLLAAWARPAGSLERMHRRYGKRFTVRLPLQPPFVILSNPDEIKQVITSAADVLHPGEGARVLEPMLGPNSVILLDEGPHLAQRRLLLPAFHGERMQTLSGLMTELIDVEVAGWPTREPFAVHQPLQRLTLEIVLRAVFGLEGGARLDQLRRLLAGVLEFSESPLSLTPALQKRMRWYPPVRRFERTIAETDRVIYDLIEERREAGGGDGTDVLSMLLGARHEDGSPMERPEIRDELMTALVAGHETTASQLAWAFLLLARAPQAAERIVAEAVAGTGTGTGTGTGDEYLTAVIHEVMRCRPVLPNAEPRLTKREVTIGEFRYPAGVALFANAFLMHRDPTLYPDPYAFRPERFLGRAPGTYTWLSFGGGRRRCLGASFAMLEMKLLLRAALQRYEVTPVPGRPERTARRSITFSPSRGARVILTARAGTERQWTSSRPSASSTELSSTIAA